MKLKLAATHAAPPPELPPGTTSFPSLSFHGLIAGPNALNVFPEPIANSSMFVLPTSTAPASRNFLKMVASIGATKLLKILEPAVVRIPLVQYKSLIEMGMPSKSPLLVPC